VDYEKDEDLARMVVRDADHAIRRIADLASLNRDFIQAEQLARKAIYEHEAAYEYPIRPKVVLSLLPQGELVTEVDFILKRNGEVNYEYPIGRLLERKKQIEQRLFVAAIEASHWLDEDGQPIRKSDRMTLKTGQEQIEEVEERIKKLSDLLISRDAKLGVERNCQYCGQPLLAGSVCASCGGPNILESGGEK